MSEEQANHDWKLAIKICKNLNELSTQDAIKKIQSLKLSDSITQKAVKIITKIEEEHNVLDHDISKIISTAPPNDSINLIYQTIGSYKILELIAKGGMSSVFKAKKVDSNVHKPVALKILSPYVFSEKSIELFNREQFILSQLEHPNIVSFHHSGHTDDGTRYLVMEYIEQAQSITEYCQNKKLSSNQIIKYLLQLTKVFIYAHNNLVIHRDIKPSNILVDSQHNLKVIDFGIGQIMSKHDKTSTQVYTKNSASPEQILGQNVCIQTDVFSLGAVMLELLVNKNPLPETNIINYNPQNDTKHINNLLKNSTLDSDLQNIIQTAMHIDKAKRYATMESFSQDLTNWLTRKPVSASSDSKLYKLKKFIVRNPLTVTLSFIILTGMILSLTIMQSLTNKAQLDADRSNKTMAFLNHILMQTDSFQSNIGDITLKQALDLSNDIPLSKIGGDVQLKALLHMKLSGIYYNMAIDDSALSQIEQALVIMNNNQKKYELSIIDANLQKGLILFGQGKLLESIQINEKMLALLKSNHPKNYNLIAMAYGNLLKAYQQNNSKTAFNGKKALDLQLKLTNMLSAELVTGNEAKLSALDALNMMANGQKKYGLVGTYLNQSLKLLEKMQQKNSASYYITKLNLAYNHIWQEKYLEAEQSMLNLIEQIEDTDPDNYFLSRVYENYASLMYQTGKKEQCLFALTHALGISRRNKNPEGLYNSLSKRAMYYSRYNMFSQGLKDQLELMPILIKQSGSSSPRTLSHLMNLSLLLFANKQENMAFRIINITTDIAETSKANNNSIANFYVTSGLLNWYASRIPAATENLKSALKYAPENEKTKVLAHLISANNGVTPLTSQQKPGIKGLYQSLLYLIQLNEGPTHPPLQQEIISQHCELSEQFKKLKLIPMKQLFLETCINLYTRVAFDVPNALTSEGDNIEKAINNSINQRLPQLQNKVNDIIELLN